MPRKKIQPKHPLKSQGMIGAYLVIIVGLLQYFGVIGPEQQVKVTVDTLDVPKQESPREKVLPISLIGAGALAAKGRREAHEAVGNLLGGQK